MAIATLGVIIGNRDFFPDHLVAEARQDVVDVFRHLDVDVLMLGENETKLGGVETYADAQKCAALFRSKSGQIDGVLVVLPNFGDEKGVADTLKLSQLNVPVLVQGYPDDPAKLDAGSRRDAFCGKISVSNNLVQAGIPFSLTRQHVVHPRSGAFRADLQRFVSVCRVVGGNERATRLSGLRVDRIKLAVYSLAGLLAAVAGPIQASSIDSAQPNAGLGYELDSIAAVVIGGTSLSGGAC